MENVLEIRKDIFDNLISSLEKISWKKLWYFDKVGFRILEFEVGHFALILDFIYLPWSLNSKSETTNLMQHLKGPGPKAKTKVPKHV